MGHKKPIVSKGSKRLATNYTVLAKILSGIIILVGLIVIFGWIYNIESLKAPFSIGISMKFTTAVSFILSGLLVFVLAHFKGEDSPIVPLVLILCVVPILFFRLNYFVSTVSDFDTSFEEYFVRDTSPAPNTMPGIPSVMTMINFLIVAMAGLICIFTMPEIDSWIAWVGRFMACTGISSVLGYLTGIEILSFKIYGLSNPMAIHTSISFILLGASLILVAKKD